MISDYERAPAKVRAGPGQRGRLSRSWSTAAARAESLPDRRRAGTTHRWAVPVADTAGLAAASVASGLSGGAPGIALRAGYGAVVLIILAGTGQHRLRIRLRVSDQAGRVLIATIVPVLAVLAWLPAHRALSLAVWSGGLVLCCRGLLYAALRAAHRRGLLTEPAVVVGAGTFGAYVAGLMREHPELGLHLVGLLDGGPPRLDLPVPFLGGPADLADVVDTLGISRVIVCFSSACRDEDFVSVMRASRPLARRRMRGAPALRARHGPAARLPGRDLGDPADSAAAFRSVAASARAEAHLRPGGLRRDARVGGTADARPGDRGPAAHRSGGTVPPGQSDR